MMHLRINTHSNYLKELSSRIDLREALDLKENFTYFHSVFKWGFILCEFLISYFIAYIINIYIGDLYLKTIEETLSYAYLLYFSLSWVGISSLRNLYKGKNIFSFRYFIRQLPVLLLAQICLISYFLFSVHINTLSSRLFFWDLALSSLFISVFRLLAFLLYKYRRFLLERSEKILIVGNTPEALNLSSYFRSIKTKVIHLTEKEKVSMNLDWTASTNLLRLKEYCIDHEISELIIAQPIQEEEIVESLQNFADNNYIRLKFTGIAKIHEAKDSHYVYLEKTENYYLIHSRQAEINFVGNTPVLTLRKQPLKSIINRASKRAFDIIFSSIAILVVLLPIYIIVGSLIKLESRGPIIFKQIRAGRKNRHFICFKFRTMYQRPEQESFKQATKNDPRITKLGAFLRKTSLDELPQLVNVFLGSMSLVGPRPHPIKLNDQYSPLINRYNYRHFTTPGITGWAQVHGYRGETRDSHLMQKRVEFDQWYIENWKFWLDAKIIFLTVYKMLKGDQNAY